MEAHLATLTWFVLFLIGYTVGYDLFKWVVSVLKSWLRM